MINGIKPTLTKTTELNVKSTSFDDAMDKFCVKLTEDSKPYVDRFNHMDNVVFMPDGGRKFIKVKYYTDTVETDYDTGEVTILEDKRVSIHCFVDKTTGDIYKPASWRAPYTKGNNAVRGNIYDSSTFEKTDMHGGWLYAR